MFLVAFYGFFRVGELTAKGATLKPLVQIQDLHFQFKDNCVTPRQLSSPTSNITRVGAPFQLFWTAQREQSVAQ